MFGFGVVVLIDANSSEHLTVTDLYTRFNHDKAVSPPSRLVCKSTPKPSYLTVHDLYARLNRADEPKRCQIDRVAT